MKPNIIIFYIVFSSTAFGVIRQDLVRPTPLPEVLPVARTLEERIDAGERPDLDMHGRVITAERSAEPVCVRPAQRGYGLRVGVDLLAVADIIRHDAPGRRTVQRYAALGRERGAVIASAGTLDAGATERVEDTPQLNFWGKFGRFIKEHPWVSSGIAAGVAGLGVGTAAAMGAFDTSSSGDAGNAANMPDQLNIVAIGSTVQVGAGNVADGNLNASGGE